MERKVIEVTNKLSPELIFKFKNGKHAAFEILFNVFYARIESFITVLTKDGELAKELTQQVFVDLWINRGKVDPARNLEAYIFTMAKNCTITALKQQMKFEVGRFDFNKEDDLQTDDMLIVKETELLVSMAVAAMPVRRKQVYEMSRYANKTNEEIATELNISKKVVEKHLRLAVTELRRILGIIFLLII